jgi:hypothetical protein
MGKASRKRRERMEQVQQAREIEGLVKRARFYDAVKQIDPIVDGAETVFDVSAVFNQIDVPETVSGASIKEWGLQVVTPPFNELFLEARLGDPLFVFEDGFVDASNVGIFIENLDQARGDRFGVVAFISPREWFVQCVIQLDELGYVKAIEHPGDAYEAPERYKQDFLDIILYWALYSLQLLNCRNIVTVDHEPDPADNAAYQRHFGVPMTTYKTLAIKPMGKRYERDGEQKQFDVMPLHIRRGNFAHYTDDAPLFGKYTGTFWRPATAVGDAKNGIRVKDYEVKP